MASQGLSFSINTAKLERKLKAYRESMYSLLRSEWAQILQECIANIVSRAPDPATELEYVLGGPFLSLPTVTYVGSDKGNQFGSYRQKYPYSGERIHFDRAPGMWIQDAVKSLSAYTMDLQNLSFGLGVVSYLENATRFSYANFSKRLGSIPHTTEYGTWSFFEYGKANTVTPRMDRWADIGSAKLKLAGDDNKSPWWLRSMLKVYPQQRMFQGFEKSVLQSSITSRLRAVKY